MRCISARAARDIAPLTSFLRSQQKARSLWLEFQLALTGLEIDGKGDVAVNGFPFALDLVKDIGHANRHLDRFAVLVLPREVLDAAGRETYDGFGTVNVHVRPLDAERLAARDAVYKLDRKALDGMVDRYVGSVCGES